MGWLMKSEEASQTSGTPAGGSGSFCEFHAVDGLIGSEVQIGSLWIEVQLDWAGP